MANLIIKLPYTTEKILYANATEEQSLYFTLENPNTATDPSYPGADAMNIKNIRIYVAASDIGADVESSITLYAGRSENQLIVAPGKTGKAICRFTMPDSLVAAMVENSVRSVPVQISVQYNDYGSERPSVSQYEYALFENVTVLSGKYSPLISAFSALRTDAGSPSDEGEDVAVKMQLSYAPDTMTQLMALHLHYAEGRDATLADEYLVLDSQITTDEISFVLGNKFSNSTDWGFLLYFGDKYENITAASSIFKAFANMHLSGAANGGVCFGGFSKSTYEQPMFECYYPAYFYGGIIQGGGGGGDYPAFGTEINTGSKWMDGKPIYRAIVETGAKTSNTMNIDVSAFNVENYITIRGMFYGQANYADGYVFPAPAAHMNNVNWTIQLEAVDRTKLAVSASSRTWKSGWILIEYTKAD